MSTSNSKKKIVKPAGRLTVFLPGVGAVATTFMAGVELIRKGLNQPIGSLAQMGTIRLGKRTEGRSPLIKDFVSLAGLKDLKFAGWDISGGTAFDAAKKAGVLTEEDVGRTKDFLQKIDLMPAVFEKNYVKRLHPKIVKEAKSKMDLAEMLREDIRKTMRRHGSTRGVMVWCGSTEIFIEEGKVHQTISAFEKGLAKNDPEIAPSMIYAYAALKEGIPFANGAPNLTVDMPAMVELAKIQNVPIAGKDFKTGQTLLKTVLAPMLKARALGLNGWFSTNILGNQDGEVLDEPGSFKTKEVSKLSALEYILQPRLYPQLYSDFYHKVRINFYPPRGDNKESWDNIDIFGWLGYPMQIKVNFLCRDSILAAPILLDLVLFMDLAQRAELSGIQEWLSFYFKSPMCAPEIYPEHDLFIQLTKLKNFLRYLMGEELITHLGVEYYEESRGRKK
ncbi:MAG TPA: inositol-3-phosphate synthase [Candidatus Acidoferrales bacterium]|nr:inositol-3-phosphate synthase [Candidatus Acidoferrales bacterium]